MKHEAMPREKEGSDAEVDFSIDKGKNSCKLKVYPWKLAMSLKQKIEDDLKAAMRAKDGVRVSCLRMLKTSLTNAEKEKRGELSDEESMTILSSLVRKGREAVGEFRKGGREDLAEKEEEEIRILYGYLPQQLTPEEIETQLKEIIAELSAGGPKDLGKVMKAAMARMAGRVQGKEVNEIAGKLLG